MSSYLKKLLGHDMKVEDLPAELRAMLTQMRQERAQFERSAAQAQETLQGMGQMAQPLAEAQKSLGDLQERMKGMERLVPILSSLDLQADALTKSHRRADIQLNQTSEDTKRLRSEMEELRDMAERANTLKNDLAGFLELGGGFKALRMDGDNLAGQVRDISQGFDRVRERQEEIRRFADATGVRLEAFEGRQTQVQSGIGATEGRVAALERSLQSLSELAGEAAQTRRQITAIKSLGDSVAQKTAALEQQRESVERALTQASHLNELTRDLEAKIRRQEEQAKTLAAMEARITELHSLHDEAQDRAEQITGRHEEIKQADVELRGRLAGLREEVQRSLQRFDLENQGLATVGQRVQDLRGSLTDMENRFTKLDESSREIADVRSRADGLMAQLQDVTDSVGQLTAQAGNIVEVQKTAGRLGQVVDEMSQRVARIETARPSVDAMLEDFGRLKGAHEAVRDALEQVRVTEAEIARTRESQSGTKSWLAGMGESVAALQSQAAALDEIKPTVELVRTEADRVVQSMAQIEGRRALIEDLERRLSTLATLGGQLDERTRALLTGMDAADERFRSLALQSEEAARIEKIVPMVIGSVERTERRLAEVDASVTSLQSRSQNLEGLAERTRQLGQELELRQATLDKAREHLDRATKLREEAATAAQELSDRSGQLTTALAVAGERAGALTDTMEDLDRRAGELRFVQKRMAQFEERVAKWEAAEAQLGQALEKFTQRQATIDTLGADMRRLFEVAERTVEDVRAISDAKEEVGQTRAMLESVLTLVEHTHDAANGLDHRKRQVEQAEERLGRAEALMTEIQSSLETLHGQRAFLDQVIEKAGALEVHSKQAESLIATLREERNVTERVRSAVAQLRQEGNISKSA